MLEILKEKNVRMIWSHKEDEYWFHAGDLGEELGVTNIRQVLPNIESEFKKKFKNSDISNAHKAGNRNSDTHKTDNSIVCKVYNSNFDTPIYNTGEVFVSEEAVYQIAFRSNKPEAKLFTIWVSKVLKQLRIKGYYIVDKKDEQWLGTRKESKANNVEYNVAIKMLVDYAIKNGSKNANRYYTIYAKEIRNSLGIPMDLDKDDLSEEQLTKIINKENEIAKMIPVFVQMKLPYKDIYKATKALIN